MKSSNSYKQLFFYALLVLAVFGMTNVTDAIGAYEIQNLQILSHHFSSEIAGYPSSRYSTNPSLARYVVLKVVGKSAKESNKLFTADFAIKYQLSNGKEERAACNAIADANSDLPGDFNTFYNGTAPRILIEKSEVRFGLAFFIESEVESFELYRIGTPETVSYKIGTARPISVYITSDWEPSKVEAIKQVLINAGCQVFTSDKLDKKVNENAIYYSQSMSEEAKEFAKLVNKETGTRLLAKASTFYGSYDIIIRLGK